MPFLLFNFDDAYAAKMVITQESFSCYKSSPNEA